MEATSKRHPLLERLRFLGISCRNLDEFVVTRLAGLTALAQDRPRDTLPDGRLPGDVLNQARASIDSLAARQQDTWRDLRRHLCDAGVVVMAPEELTSRERAWLSEDASSRLLPLLTPVALDATRPFPFVGSLQTGVIMDLERFGKEERFPGVVILPQAMPRFVELPDLYRRGAKLFLSAEHAIGLLVGRLFPGCRPSSAGVFRVLRDSELDVEAQPDDLYASFERALKERRRAAVVRLEVSHDVGRGLVRLLEQRLGAAKGSAVETGPMLGLRDLLMLTEVDRPDLKYPPFVARLPAALKPRDADLFSLLRARDLLVHHPYEAFDPVTSLIVAAADDPDVVSIKQTLYRTSERSPIVDALAKAAEAGKSVTAVVEVKARFDEAANLRWARRLERAGAQVVFGFADLKTHAKLALVARREASGIVSYSHLGTGNYNPDTARVYTDVSYLTSDAVIGRDVGRVFNFITGSCRPEQMETLTISPFGLRDRLLEAIGDEMAHAAAGRPAAIWAKCNSLSDPTVIEALYAASAAGVEIDLVVRGICCLRPGVRGLSDRIRVKSILGRFLEHSRLYAFGNGHGLPHPRAHVFIASADLMPRNFDRRVETLLPVTEPGAHERLLAQILAANVLDTAGSWALQPDGGSIRLAPAEGEQAFDAQAFFMTGVGPVGRAPREPTTRDGAPELRRAG